jgi:hypothetical protein
LDGFNVTPDNYRGYLRVLLLAQGASSFCNGLKGLSAAEFLALPTASSRETPMATPPANWTPVPGQTKNPDDALAAAQILIDECDRVSP